MGISFILCIFLLTLSPDGWTRPGSTGPSRGAPRIVFVEAARVAFGGLSDRFPQGSRLAWFDPASKSPEVKILTEGFFAAADPRPSFDGTTVLFSGQKGALQAWQVWEMNADGSGPRQVTSCPADCLRPNYLPKDEIVYSAARNEAGRTEWQLMVSKRDGTDARPITFGPGDFEVETVLRNGLIVASASWPLQASGPRARTRQLYTIKPDGTELESLRYEHAPAGVKTEAAELDDGSIVFEGASIAGAAAGGKLAEIGRGALHGAALGSQAGFSWSASEFTGDELIVSRLVPASAGGSGRFDLYSFDVKTAAYRRRIYSDPHFSSIQAVPLAAHETPKWFWSLVEPKGDAGRLICLDSYLSGDAPKGRIETKIAHVRVLTITLGSNQEKSLGEAPVESDGSFYIAVPPDRPVRFELLDVQGRVIRAQKGWVWARPGEDRGCAGCHEDRTITPANRWPLALKRFDTPTQMGTANHSETKP